MGQVLHGSATTTHAVRAAIQRSKATVAELAEQYSLNEKTVRKWRKRSSVEDAPMGPKNVRSSVLSPEEEAVCVAFRRHTLLPLDDCLYASQATIPHLSRSALHRLFQRHGISRLPDVRGEPKRKFRSYPIGYVHIDIAEVRTEEGKLYLFVAIDRTSKFVFVKLVEKAGKMAAAQFLRELVEAVRYRIHTVLTDNDIQFTNQASDRYAFHHIFDRVCDENGIEHRKTKVNHPWTNGQVERMNRTIKEATVRRYHYGSHEQLRSHLADFIGAYNYARGLKTLRGLTPFEFVTKCWTEKPQCFRINPAHHTTEPNTWGRRLYIALKPRDQHVMMALEGKVSVAMASIELERHPSRSPRASPAGRPHYGSGRRSTDVGRGRSCSRSQVHHGHNMLMLWP